MKLNLLERFFILSPLRSLLQRHLEAPQLLEMGGPVGGGTVLEIGCGPGGGIELMYNTFGAAAVDAFDIDPRMIAHIHQRDMRRKATTNLWTGNIRQMPVASNRYDAVFNFGAIHHVVDWRAALAEVFRVLKPGGRFFCEEILKHYITHPVWGRLMQHPQDDRFDQAAFVLALNRVGFEVRRIREMANLYLWVIADKPGE